MEMKRMMPMFAVIVTIFSNTFAVEKGHEKPAIATPVEYEKIKSLVGKWEGTTVDNGQENPTTVTYELISGGTAVMERLAVGTNHEMVSIYHPEGKGVAMTHYCVIGNQPKMHLKKATANTYAFEMKGSEGLRNKSEMHIHALDLKWADADNIEETWTGYENGKKLNSTVFKLHRKK